MSSFEWLESHAWAHETPMAKLVTLVALIGLTLGGVTVGCASSTDDKVAPQTNSDNELNAAAAENAAPLGRAMSAKLRVLAPKVTLGFLGEDSGGACVASFRKGPAADLSPREVLRLFQFNVEAQLASDEFSFRAQDPKDKDFWDSFESAQFDEEGTRAAKEIRALLTSADVTGLAIMIPADRVAFGGSAFLLARLKDASLVAVRGSIGGMTL